MFELQWPLALLFLPLPVIAWFLLPLAPTTRNAALKVPHLEDFQLASQQGQSVTSSLLSKLLLLLAWALLVLATARPQWIGEALELPVSGRDLMLAVDLSGSMEIDDFEIGGRKVARLSAAKVVARDFIERREGDRLGLILFGRKAYLQTPLTFDLHTVTTLLMESAIGLAGKETAIGDAIGLATKRLKDSAQGSRVLVLMTDGANTAGEIEPIRAAELAQRYGLKIYTIGIGADEIVRMGLFGRQLYNPSSDLDEKTLKAIAKATGGQYFRARDTAELDQIYQQLDSLEPVEVDSQTFRPVRALFMWPLASALLLCVLLIGWRIFSPLRG